MEGWFWGCPRGSMCREEHPHLCLWMSLSCSPFLSLFWRGFTSIVIDFFEPLICQIFVLTEATPINFRSHLRCRKKPKTIQNISKWATLILVFRLLFLYEFWDLGNEREWGVAVGLKASVWHRIAVFGLCSFCGNYLSRVRPGQMWTMSVCERGCVLVERTTGNLWSLLFSKHSYKVADTPRPSEKQPFEDKDALASPVCFPDIFTATQTAQQNTFLGAFFFLP